MVVNDQNKWSSGKLILIDYDLAHIRIAILLLILLEDKQNT